MKSFLEDIKLLQYTNIGQSVFGLQYHFRSNGMVPEEFRNKDQLTKINVTFKFILR